MSLYERLANKPFTTGQGMIRFIKGSRRRGKDVWISNEGLPGTGKSTTTGNIASHLKPGFNLRRDSIRDFDHLLQALYECEDDGLYIVDEAVNIFHNQEWNTWWSKKLSQLYRQNRIMRGTWILNQPDFDGLHPYVRNSRINIRIYHPTFYDGDGFTNGPSQVLFRQDWFSLKEQRSIHRWQLVIDKLEVDCLDDEPEWSGYEDDKRDNFRHLVGELMERNKREKAKEQRAMAKNGVKAGQTNTPPLLRKGGPKK